MLKPSLTSCIRALALLLIVYLPTFAIVSAFIMPLATSSPPDTAVMIAALPLVIGISLVIALILIAIVGGRQFRSYGFQSTTGRTLLLSLCLGLGIGFALRGLAWSFGVEDPPLFTGLATWQIILFTWIGASIQEEIIFRGLFQTTLERGIPAVVTIGRGKLSVAALVSAAIFSLVHLGLLSVGAAWESVAFVGGGALLLGVVAGQFRWRTGSLFPGMVLHTLSNVAASV